MQKGISLQELSAKILANSELKRDYIVDASKTMVKLQSDNTPVLAIPDHGEFPIQRLAHRQIGEKLKIPAQFYDRLLKDYPGLYATTATTLLQAEPSRRMARTLGGDLRAWLSDGYQRIEYEDVAKTALPILSEIPGIHFPSVEITDYRLYIHFVVPTIQGEVKVGDVVQAGGLITDSEVGLGAVAVSGFLLRLACLNGMKTSDTFRRNHIGRRAEEDGELNWAEDTRRADDKAVLLKVRDMIKAVVDEGRFKENLERMRALAESRQVKSVTKAVEVLAQKVTLTEGEQGDILEALARGGDLTAWGVVNAVTSQAHTAKTYDRAVELEAIGGKLLALPAPSWREIVEAE
jgi:hypothetical protein